MAGNTTNNQEEDGETGYAKLLGRRTVERPDGTGMLEEDFDAIVTALPARLGRTHAVSQESLGDGCFVPLGNIKSLSRHHATIEWDFNKGHYKITCLSKNGMVVNKLQYAKDEYAALYDRSAVRLGPVNFYFHLPPGEGEEEEEGLVRVEEVEEEEEEEEGGGKGGGKGQTHKHMEEEEGEGKEGGSEGGGGGGSESGSAATAGGGKKKGGGGSVYGEGGSSSSLDFGGSTGGGGGGGGGFSASKLANSSRRQATTKPEGSESYADMVFKVFKSAEFREQGAGIGLTSHEIATWIFTNYPEWDGPIERKRQLQNGVQNALTRKFAKQEQTAAAGRGCRWKMFPAPVGMGGDDDSNTHTHTHTHGEGEGGGGEEYIEVDEESRGAGGGGGGGGGGEGVAMMEVEDEDEGGDGEQGEEGSAN